MSKVSADRTVEPKTGQPYYMVRITMGSTDLLPKDVALRPGMPVDAMIRSGSRTFLQYLAKPITDFAAKGMYEGRRSIHLPALRDRVGRLEDPG